MGTEASQYIKDNKKTLYAELLNESKLNNYLVSIDRQATGMLDSLIKKMKVLEDITEKLKSEDQMAWVSAMNSIHNRVEKVVYHELIQV